MPATIAAIHSDNLSLENTEGRVVSLLDFSSGLGTPVGTHGPELTVYLHNDISWVYGWFIKGNAHTSEIVIMIRSA